MISVDPYKPGGPTRSLEPLGFSRYAIDLYGNVKILKTGEYLKNQMTGNRYSFAGIDNNGKQRRMSVDYAVAYTWWDLTAQEIQKFAPDIFKDTYNRILAAQEFNLIPINDKRAFASMNLEWYTDTIYLRYYVTRYGDIWNEARYAKIHCECSRSGYPMLSTTRLAVESDDVEKYRLGKTIGVHRLVAMAFVPIPDEYARQGLTFKDLEVHHFDANPKNNRWSNLIWCTPEDHKGKFHPAHSVF